MGTRKASTQSSNYVEKRDHYHSTTRRKRSSIQGDPWPWTKKLCSITLDDGRPMGGDRIKKESQTSWLWDREVSLSWGNQPTSKLPYRSDEIKEFSIGPREDALNLAHARWWWIDGMFVYEENVKKRILEIAEYTTIGCCEKMNKKMFIESTINFAFHIATDM